MTYTFTLSGPIKPYTRMTRNGQWVDPAAKAYKDSQAALRWQLKAQMLERGWAMLPAKTPLKAAITLEMPGRLHCQDADNQAKALIDSAQGVVFPNDLWIDEVIFERQLGNTHKTIFSIGVIGNVV